MTTSGRIRSQLGRSLVGGCGGAGLIAGALVTVADATPAGPSRQLAAPVIEVRLPVPRAAIRSLAPTQSANPARPAVAVRSGQHQGFKRLVFDWPDAVTYQVGRTADTIVIRFDRPGALDLRALHKAIGAAVLGVEVAEDGQRIMLRIPPDANIRAFDLARRKVVVDVFSDGVEAGTTAAVPDGPSSLLPDTLQHGQALAVMPPTAAKRSPADWTAVAKGRALEPAQFERRAQTEAPQPTPVRSRAKSAAAPGTPTAQARSEPRQFEVDEDAIDRALERTLVDVGALLLPPGKLELAPSLSYVRKERSAPFVVAQTEMRRNEATASLPVRVGLPWDAQFELSLPYRFVDQSQVLMVGFTEQQAVDESGHGLGDLRLGLAKTLWQENGSWAPDLIGRVTWDSDFGDTEDNGVPLGGGFHEITGAVSALKRQDPLAFFGNLSYETTFENDRVDPGDDLGVTVGTILAASPDTSLRLALDQHFVQNVEINGEEVDGSDQVAGSLSLGASSILGRGVLLNAAVDIGLTDDAPDYAVSLSLPIRLDLPRRMVPRLNTEP